MSMLPATWLYGARTDGEGGDSALFWGTEWRPVALFWAYSIAAAALALALMTELNIDYNNNQSSDM